MKCVIISLDTISLSPILYLTPINGKNMILLHNTRNQYSFEILKKISSVSSSGMNFVPDECLPPQNTWVHDLHVKESISRVFRCCDTQCCGLTCESSCLTHGNSIVCLTSCSGYQQINYRPFVSGIPMDSEHKGQLIRKICPCHDVIMSWCLDIWFAFINSQSSVVCKIA